MTESRLFIPTAGPWWWVVVDYRDKAGRWYKVRRWTRHSTEGAALEAADECNKRAADGVRFRVELEALEAV